MHALRVVRDGRVQATEEPGREMRRFLRTLVTIIRMEQTAGSPWGLYPRPRSFFEKLEKWLTGLEADLAARGRRLFAEPACSGSLAMSD